MMQHLRCTLRSGTLKTSKETAPQSGSAATEPLKFSAVLSPTRLPTNIPNPVLRSGHSRSSSSSQGC